MPRGLSAGAYFRGCVSRTGVIRTVDETATDRGRAGAGLLDLVASPDRPAVRGLLADSAWDGLRVLHVCIPGHATPYALVAAAAGRLVDVAMLLLRTGEELLLARDFQQLFEPGEQGVWAFAADRTPMFSNARMARLLRCSPQELLLQPERFVQPGPVAVGPLRRADGQPLAATLGTVRLATAAGERLGELLLADDAPTDRPSTDDPPTEDTERSAPTVRLARARLHDPLTGLPNRSFLTQQYSAETEGLALILCNLRGFAMFNRQYGGDRGDQLLCGVADRLSALVAPGQVLVRLAKDEFVVAAPRIDQRAAGPLVVRLRAAFAQLMAIRDLQYQVRLSCGIATADSGRPADVTTMLTEAATAAH